MDTLVASRNGTICEFNGSYRWLSNFAPCEINLDGKIYQSVENAYQAAKTLIVDERIQFESITAGQAKIAGRQHVTIRPDWHKVKKCLMMDLNRQKYTNEVYKNKLLATGEAKLIEGNHWGDTFWGMCDGDGMNHLGKILMKIRTELKFCN